MARREIPFAAQEGATGATQNSQETLINMYAEVTVSGRSQIIRRQRPCVRQVVANTGEKRCIEKFGATHYCVIGTGFYSFDGTALTLLGSLASGSGRCTMIRNDNAQIMISDGAVPYYWNGTTLAMTTSPYAIGHLAYINGFGIGNIPGTGQFAITGENDFSSIDALDFATAASSPDGLVTVAANHSELWLAGEKTTEVWQPSTSEDFPFAALTNAQIERGCGAALSYASEDNTLFFLGDDWIVYRNDGYRPQVISSRAIEYAIEQVPVAQRSSAYSMIFTSRGHKHYVLTFPGYLSADYNITTQLWSRVKTFGYNHWAVLGSAGHTSDYCLTPTGICALDPGVNQDEGQPVWRGGISAPGWVENGEQVTIYEFFLDAQVGRAAIGKTANVTLRFAPDGETFGNERVRTLGATGEYSARAMWRSLGQGRKPVIEIGTTDDFEFTIISTGAAMEAASS